MHDMRKVNSSKKQGTNALVLPGGGARGAYQVGQSVFDQIDSDDVFALQFSMDFLKQVVFGEKTIEEQEGVWEKRVAERQEIWELRRQAEIARAEQKKEDLMQDINKNYSKYFHFILSNMLNENWSLCPHICDSPTSKACAKSGLVSDLVINSLKFAMDAFH